MIDYYSIKEKYGSKVAKIALLTDLQEGKIKITQVVEILKKL
jgi:hypothetical protein